MFSSQFKPMLAASALPFGSEPKGSYQGLISDIRWPKIATPKVDGIRGIIKDGKLLSRKLIPIPNNHVREICEAVLPEGFDVELVVPGADYNTTQSAIMSGGGRPNFIAHVIDWAGPDEYDWRYTNVYNELYDNKEKYFGTASQLIAETLDNQLEFEQYLEKTLYNGYEGVCLRGANSPYKFGRSTFNEQYLLKVKPFSDLEATIIGFEELQTNLNPRESDNLGNTKRSSHLSGLVGAEKLGAFVVHSPEFGIFTVGSGFTEEQRINYWFGKSALEGQTITIKYLPYGTKDKPRHPVFKGLRRD